MTATSRQVVQGFDPRTGEPTGEPVPVTTDEELRAVLDRAAAAAPRWAATSRADRADVLDRIAAALDGAVADLVAVADAETALGNARLTGEVARTSGQLRMFGEILRDGSYLDVVISHADEASARPDLRRMMFPIGPVAVYAASNFPFAFSVLGGDTASALASGCPVVVKAHEAHPRTSVAVAQLAADALTAAGIDPGVLQLVHGFDPGVQLIKSPVIKAAGFTGSLRGGRALFDLAAQRPDPIPFYGELGSVNPVVVLPGAATRRTDEIASGYAGSLTLGSGQFCTNPGVAFVPESSTLAERMVAEVAASTGSPMLTSRMRDAYEDVVEARDTELGAQAGEAQTGAWSVAPRVWRVSLDQFVQERELGREIFGPAGVVVTYGDIADLIPVLRELEGSLTASVHAVDTDHADVALISEALRPIAGRLVFNGWPTGVAVCWAVQHGGPWPSTTAAWSTSVGARAIDRWLVPTAFQSWPDALLPAELQEANPLNVARSIQP